MVVAKLIGLEATSGSEAFFAIVELKRLKVYVDLLHHFDPSIGLRILVNGLIGCHLD